MTQSTPDLKEKVVETPNLKKMTKRNLITLAKEHNIKVSMAMTKANIIKTIEDEQ